MKNKCVCLYSIQLYVFRKVSNYRVICLLYYKQFNILPQSESFILVANRCLNTRYLFIYLDLWHNLLLLKPIPK